MALVGNALVVFILLRINAFRLILSVEHSMQLEVIACLVLMDIRLTMENVFLVHLPSFLARIVEIMIQLGMCADNAVLGILRLMVDVLLFLMIVIDMI